MTRRRSSRRRNPTRRSAVAKVTTDRRSLGPRPGFLGEWVGLPGTLALLAAVGFWWSGPEAEPWFRDLNEHSAALLGVLVAALALLALVLRQGRAWIVAGILAASILDLGPATLPSTPLALALLPLCLVGTTALAPRHPLRRRNLAAMALLVLLGWLLQAPDVLPTLPTVREMLTRLPPTLPAIAFVAAGIWAAVLLLRRSSPLARAALWSLPYLYLAGVHLSGRPDLETLASVVILLLWIAGTLGEAHALSFRDALTQLPGRRAFDRELAELGRRYVLAMVDIDHFKRVNDRHGHEVGDQVLAKVATHLGRVRGGRAFRYGGEEFVLVFRGGRPDDCRERLEALRQRIAAAPFGVRGSKQRLKVSVSIGTAERNGSRSSPEDVLAAADKALYRAKRNGRNRVVQAR